MKIRTRFDLMNKRKKKVVNGLAFDSELEERFYRKYLVPKADREVGVIEQQIPFPIEFNGCLVSRYIADFVYTVNNKKTIYECKGFFMGDAKMKLRCVQAIYGIPIVIVYSLKKMEILVGYKKKNKRIEL